MILVHFAVALAMWLLMIRDNYVIFTKYRKYVAELNPVTDFLNKKLGLIPSFIITTSVFIILLTILYMTGNTVAIINISIILAIINLLELAQLKELQIIGMLNEALINLYQMEKEKSDDFCC